MADNMPVTSVGALTAKVTQAITNINAHRAAMAQVAAQVKATVPTPPKEGVKQA